MVAIRVRNHNVKRPLEFEFNDSLPCHGGLVFGAPMDNCSLRGRSHARIVALSSLWKAL